MTAYTVSTVSKMLGVNEETIRRWIRAGKLNAKRAVGRGGNSIQLEDVIDFANTPPRAHLSSLEVWLSSNGIAYEKINDPLDNYDDYNELKTVAGVSKVLLESNHISPKIAAPAAIGVLGAYGATKIFKKKNYQSYSIQLINCEEENKIKKNTDSVDAIRFQNADFIENDNSPLIELPDISNETAIEQPTHIFDNTEQEHLFYTNATKVLDDIARAKQMLDSEIITQEDFNIIKTRLISML